MKRIASTSRRRSTLPAALVLAAACAPGAHQAPEPSPDTASREIVAMLDASAAAWNRGDLDGYIGDYAPDATFVGSAGLIRGASEIRRLYAEGYWSSGTPRDALRFEMLNVRIIRPGAATAVGRYILYDRGSGEATGTGVFTLALARVDGAWKILHDHSSADGQD